MPEHRVVDLGDVAPATALAAARELLAARRYRVRADDPATDGPAGAVSSAYGSVSAERGYLREVGNLLFHLALLVVIVAVAVGHLLGWRVDAIVPAGETFANTTSQHDTFTKGPWVDEESLPPFTVRVDKVTVDFETGLKGKQFGQPRSFEAATTTRATPDSPEVRQRLAVNEPLSFGQSSVYLLGNGYAPIITVKDGQGRQVYHQATVFRPQDNNYTSNGAVKVSALPDGKQLGFLGMFAPTISDQGLRMRPQSDFPAPVAPGLLLELWEGTLFPDGRPQSVYTLDTSRMTQPRQESGLPVRIALRPGRPWRCPAAGERDLRRLRALRRSVGALRPGQAGGAGGRRAGARGSAHVLADPTPPRLRPHHDPRRTYPAGDGRPGQERGPAPGRGRRRPHRRALLAAAGRRASPHHRGEPPMTHPALAQYSTLCVYASLLVLGVAFVAFALDLAQVRHRALDAGDGMMTASGGTATCTTASVGAAGGGTDTLVRTAAGSPASPGTAAPVLVRPPGSGLPSRASTPCCSSPPSCCGACR